MSRRANRQQQALARERERRREQDQRRYDRAVDAEQAVSAAGVRLPLAPVDPTAESLASGRRVAGQALTCGWCGQPIVLRSTGRMPKWCSQSCRQRAWEQTRAARSGDSAVRVVDRYVADIPVGGPGWIAQLGTLSEQIANQLGQIADRDLDQLAAALELAQAAVANRAQERGRRRY